MEVKMFFSEAAVWTLGFVARKESKNFDADERR
jgi:hypothetical protein